MATAMHEGIAALRAEIESVAQDPATPADDRASELQRLRDELELVLGACDTYLGGLARRQEADATVAREEIERFRENPAIREEMLRRGLATAEQLDEAGIFSAEEIARLEEEGLLEATVGEWSQRLHPRNRRGQFRDVPNLLDVAGDVRDRGVSVLGPNYSENVGKLRRARDRAQTVRVDTYDGRSFTGGVRNVGGLSATIEDSDGQGHRVRLPDVESVTQDSGDLGGPTIKSYDPKTGPSAAERAANAGIMRGDSPLNPFRDGNALPTNRQGQVFHQDFLPGKYAKALITGAAGSDVGIGFNLKDGRAFRDVEVVDAEDDSFGFRSVNDPDSLGTSLPYDKVDSITSGFSGLDKSVAQLADSMNEDPMEKWKHFDQDRSQWHPPEGVTYSPDVQAIASPEDAVAYLGTRGVDASGLIPPDTEQGRNIRADTDFFRQLSQAVTDAQDRYPVLKNGPVPFKHLTFWSSLPTFGSVGMSEDDKPGVWAATAVNIGETGKDANPMWSPFVAPPAKAHDTWIALNDRNQNGVQIREWPEGDWDGATARADKTPYGRLMHELGHATYSASGEMQKVGIEFQKLADGQEMDTPDLEILREAIPDPMDFATNLGYYGASSPAEAWAEMFATLNVPGALQELPSEIQADLSKAQRLAQDRFGEKLL